MMVIGVEFVGIQGLAGTFAYGAEGLLAQAGELCHNMRDAVDGGKIAAVISDFKNGPVFDRGHLLAYDFVRNLLGDGHCLDFRDCLLDLLGQAFGFEGVGAVAQILPEFGNVVPAYLFGGDGLAYAHLDVGSLLVQELVDEPDGAEAGMYLSEEMEELGVRSFEIDGNDGESGVLDELDYVLGPGLVFYDLAVTIGRALVFLLIGCDFACGEEAEGAAVVNVLESHTYPLDALGPAAFAEVVDGHEAASQAGDQCEKEGGEDAVIGPDATYYRAEYEPVYASEMVVGNGDESAFEGDPLELLFGDLVCDSDFLENLLGEGGAVVGHILFVDLVYLVYFQEMEYASGDKTPKGSFESKGVLQVGFRYYVLLFFHKVW